MEATKTMKAIVLEEYGKPAVVKEVPIPVPKSGQVLIRVEAAPINPSDTSNLKGNYSSGQKLPCTPGFEGSGYVVKSGGIFFGCFFLQKYLSLFIKKNILLQLYLLISLFKFI